MKRKHSLALLVGLGLAILAAGQALACKKRCCNDSCCCCICCKPYNAFSPCCCGTICCTGCCPQLSCPTPPPPPVCVPPCPAPPPICCMPPVDCGCCDMGVGFGAPFMGPQAPVPWSPAHMAPPPGPRANWYAPPPGPPPAPPTSWYAPPPSPPPQAPAGVYPGFWPNYPAGYWTTAYSPGVYGPWGAPNGR